MGKNKPLGRFLKTLAIVFFLSLFAYLTYSFYLSITYPLRYEPAIEKYSKLNGIDPYLLAAVIREESRFDPEVTSKKGAVGLMQVMPETATWISVKAEYAYKEGDLEIPEYNIKFGSWYYGYLKKKYGSTELALAAYNGGTANVDKWIKKHGFEKAKESIPFEETKNFVDRVMQTSETYKRLYPGAFNSGVRD